MNRILVCNPAYYGVTYKINPWMKPEKPTNRKIANYQWLDLVQLLVTNGVQVFQMQGTDGLPDIVFTANAGTVFENKVVLSNFTHPQRQPEKEFYRTYFRALGFEILDLPADKLYEGAGDALFDDAGILWCGHGHRSDPESHKLVGQMFGVETRLLNLVNPSYYHLDTCFCPLRDDHALVYPAAFDKMSYEALKSFHLIEVPADEARRFACNAICIDRTVIMPAKCPVTQQKLEEAGYTVHQTPMTEFIKAGGACKCLSLKF